MKRYEELCYRYCKITALKGEPYETKSVLISSISFICVLCFQVQFYLQFFKLLLINSTWGIQHHVPATVVFWEGDKITYAFAATQQRTEPVKSECNTTMRRSTIFKSTE